MAEGSCTRLQFYPFAYALSTEELANYCWYCLAPLGEFGKSRCTGCQCALYCNRECHLLGWKDHKAECSAINKTHQIPDIECRVLGRIVVRYKDISKKKDVKTENFYKDRTSERSIMDIWAHTEEIKKDQRAMKRFDEIYAELTAFYESRYMLPKETVFELHCRNYINRHAISDNAYIKEIGKGLYLDLCAYDHSCRPNTIYTCTGFVATLRSLDASNDIRNRETTHYTYIDLINSQPERQKQLKDTWYFECKCDRCVDPNDHRLTGLKCPNCPKDKPTNLCIFGTHEYKNKSTAIINCPECKQDMPRDYVFEGINTMKYFNKVIADQEVEQMPQKTRMEFLEDLLERGLSILPDVNVYLCMIVQKMIRLTDVSNHAELLRLHLLSEPCVRYCYPPKHPGVAFHLRSIGLLYNGVRDYENATKYILEAIEILHFTLDDNHPMTKETNEMLKETLELSAIAESSGPSSPVKTVKSTVVAPQSSKIPKAVEQGAEPAAEPAAGSVAESSRMFQPFVPAKAPAVEKLPEEEKPAETAIAEKPKEPETKKPKAENANQPGANNASDLFCDSVDDLPELIA